MRCTNHSFFNLPHVVLGIIVIVEENKLSKSQDPDKPSQYFTLLYSIEYKCESNYVSFFRYLKNSKKYFEKNKLNENTKKNKLQPDGC